MFSSCSLVWECFFLFSGRGRSRCLLFLHLHGAALFFLIKTRGKKERGGGPTPFLFSLCAHLLQLKWACTDDNSRKRSAWKVGGLEISNTVQQYSTSTWAIFCGKCTNETAVTFEGQAPSTVGNNAGHVWHFIDARWPLNFRVLLHTLGGSCTEDPRPPSSSSGFPLIMFHLERFPAYYDLFSWSLLFKWNALSGKFRFPT